MAPANRSEDAYYAPSSIAKNNISHRRMSPARGQTKVSGKPHLKQTRSSSLGRNENEASMAWPAFEPHSSKRTDVTRKTNVPGKASNDGFEMAITSLNSVTPLNDVRQFDYTSTRSTPVSLSLAEEASLHVGYRQPISQHNPVTATQGEYTDAALDEAMLRTDKSLRKQKMKSPMKGAKGALGWLIKPFAKDSHTLSTPASTVSKPSMKSFESELWKLNKVSMEATTGSRMVQRRRLYPDTPEHQQRRWLLQVHRAIRDSAVREVMIRSVAQRESIRHTPKQQLDDRHAPDSRLKTRDSSSESGVFEEPTILIPDTNTGYNYPSPRLVTSPARSPARKPHYGAYSTFDDEQSVSSMELLFNWLTCKDVNVDERRHARRYDPRLERIEFDLQTASTDPYTQKKSVGFCR